MLASSVRIFGQSQSVYTHGSVPAGGLACLIRSFSADQSSRRASNCSLPGWFGSCVCCIPTEIGSSALYESRKATTVHTEGGHVDQFVRFPGGYVIRSTLFSEKSSLYSIFRSLANGHRRFIWKILGLYQAQGCLTSEQDSQSTGNTMV